MRRAGRSILDPFLPHLARCLGEGCEDAITLWRELKGIGYGHGPKIVQCWVAENHTRPVPRTARKWLPSAPATTTPSVTPDIPPIPGPALPSPKQLAWLLVRPAEVLSPADAAAVRWVGQDKEAGLVASLAQPFTVFIRRCGIT